VRQYIKDKYDYIDPMFDTADYHNEFGSYEADQCDNRSEAIRGAIETMVANRDVLVDLLRRDLREGSLKELSEEIIKFLQVNGVDTVDTDSKEFKKLATKLCDANIQILPLEADRLQGGFSYKHDMPKLFPEVFPRGTAQLGIAKPQTSDTIKKATDDFWNEYYGGDVIKARTRNDYADYLKHTVEYFGSETQIHTIDYAKVKEFRDGLRSGDCSLSGKSISVDRINNYIMLIDRTYELAMLKDFQLIRNPDLMVAFNHSTQRQTLDYLCIQAKEQRDSYLNEL
jgi:hypothetical protein